MAFSSCRACPSSATTTAAPGAIAVHAINMTATAEAADNVRIVWFVIANTSCAASWPMPNGKAPMGWAVRPLDSA